MPIGRGKPPRSRPGRFLDVTLAPGWTYDSVRRAFVSPWDEVVSLRGLLPKGARVHHKDPVAAQALRRRRPGLDPLERELARHVQVILPPRARVDKAAKALAGLACVRRAAPSAEISAP